jgi:hypothetical protein
MDCKTVTSSSIENPLKRAESRINFLFLFQRFFYVVRTWSLSICALETLKNRKAILLAVTIFGSTAEFASVPNFWRKFHVLRLKYVKFVFSTVSFYLRIFWSFSFQQLPLHIPRMIRHSLDSISECIHVENHFWCAISESLVLIRTTRDK